MRLRDDRELAVIDHKSQKKIKFSPAAQDHIRGVLETAKREQPDGDWVPYIQWTLSASLRMPSGEVRRKGPYIGIGAMHRKSLTNEAVVQMGGITVAVDVPDDLKAVDRLDFDDVDGDLVLAK
jgi:hypothetical protein